MKHCDASRTAAIASLVVVLATGCADDGDGGPGDRRTGPSLNERRVTSERLTSPPASRSSGATSAPSASTSSDWSGHEAAPSDGPALSYSRQRTVACLQKGGARVGDIRGWDERRTAFADLAQANSVEVSRKSRNVLMAFTESPESAAFLVETLTVPDDPYRLVAHGSVVMLYRPKASQQAATIGDCLR